MVKIDLGVHTSSRDFSIMEPETNNSAPDELEDGLEYEVEEDVEDETAAEGIRVEELPDESDSDIEVTPADGGKSKKRRKNMSQIEKKKQKFQLLTEQKQNCWKLTEDLLIDFILNRARSMFPDLSTLELSDQYGLRASNIQYTGSWTKPRNLDGYNAFLRNYFPRFLGKGDESSGWIIILSMSAIRVCDILRATRTNKNGLKAIKLISKNKLKDDEKIINGSEQIKKKLFISTPLRLKKLIEIDCIKKASLKKNLKGIVIDSSYLNAKQQSIWDIDLIDKFIPFFKNDVMGPEDDFKFYLY